MEVSIKNDLHKYLSSSHSSERPSFDSFLKNIKLPNLYSGHARQYHQVSQDDEADGDGTAANAEWIPDLSKKNRIIGFFLCLAVAVICFSLAFLYLPFLILKVRKFALLYTLGSLFSVCSFAILFGPLNHVRHLCSGAQLPFTVPYFGTMFLTLYFALVVKSTILTLVCAIAQILSLIWYTFSRIPGGQNGLKFFSKLFCMAFHKSVARTLPV